MKIPWVILLVGVITVSTSCNRQKGKEFIGTWVNEVPQGVIIYNSFWDIDTFEGDTIEITKDKNIFWVKATKGNSSAGIFLDGSYVLNENGFLKEYHESDALINIDMGGGTLIKYDKSSKKIVFDCGAGQFWFVKV